jgi:hypothetical protein
MGNLVISYGMVDKVRQTKQLVNRRWDIKDVVGTLVMLFILHHIQYFSRGNVTLMQDVDNAFGFLNNYDTITGTIDHRSHKIYPR